MPTIGLLSSLLLLDHSLTIRLSSELPSVHQLSALSSHLRMSALGTLALRTSTSGTSTLIISDFRLQEDFLFVPRLYACNLTVCSYLDFRLYLEFLLTACLSIIISAFRLQLNTTSTFQYTPAVRLIPAIASNIQCLSIQRRVK